MITLNGVEIKPTIFPDGTSQVWKIDSLSDQEYIIEWEFETDAEIFHICQLAHLLSYEDSSSYITLKVDTLPYARQDKPVSNTETFARSTLLNILKASGVHIIETIDCHSPIYSTMEIIDKKPSKEIRSAMLSTAPTLICYPDKGAKDRYESLPILEDFPSCSFTKARNQETGRIERLDLNELVGIEGETVLIIDDICDGGMTFKLTAERLLTLGAKDVILYTTHGIYSKGIQTLKDSGISRIFNRNGEVK